MLKWLDCDYPSMKTTMTNLTKHYIKEIEKTIKGTASYSINEQYQLVQSICTSLYGAQHLIEILVKHLIIERKNLSYTDAIIFRQLSSVNVCNIKNKLEQYFSNGIVNLESSQNINYTPLYKALMYSHLEEANLITHKYLNQLAGLNNQNQRQWLYFTDITKLPSLDLYTIDNIWRIYSCGRFGYSIQRMIWLRNNKNWDKLWVTIGWKTENNIMKYPKEFTWNFNAPQGHLPLWNQLRGVQVLSALFEHPIWNNLVFDI